MCTTVEKLRKSLNDKSQLLVCQSIYTKLLAHQRIEEIYKFVSRRCSLSHHHVIMYALSYITVYIVLSLLSISKHTSEAVTVKQSYTTKPSKPKVLLLSVGGLRADYLASMNLTHINQMIANGTKAKYVENAVNVLDIVNHYSIVTGLYPESHGIISHIMFDPKLNRVFNSKTRSDAEWWVNVHPIWHEIENQGLGLSALCRWPGVYGPMMTTLHCDQRKSFKSDIDQALIWLRDDVQLVLLYSDDLKKAALRWGPYSQEAINELKQLDMIIKYVLHKTRDHNVNILLTSDSGVTDLNDQYIDLDQCLDPKSYVLTQSQATLLIYPKRGYTVQELHQNLTKCKHVKVYLKEELPERFHFSNNRRIPPVIAFVPLGTVVRSSKGDQRISWYNMGGSGYHPGYELMRGIFIGYGPSFQKGLEFQAIKNVDIYVLVCHILGMTPRPNNGSYDVVKSMFHDMTSFAVDVTGDVMPASIITPQGNSTGIPPQQTTAKMWMEADATILFWVLVAMTALLLLFLCGGCFITMYRNYKRGYGKTVVHEPGAKCLLSEVSSDEE